MRVVLSISFGAVNGIR